MSTAVLDSCSTCPIVGTTSVSEQVLVQLREWLVKGKKIQLQRKHFIPGNKDVLCKSQAHARVNKWTIHVSSPNSRPGQRASGGLTIRRIQSHPPSRQTTTFLALQEENQTTGSSGAEPARALNTPTESYNLFLQPSSTGRPVLKVSLAVELVCHLRPGKGHEKMNVGMRTSTLCLGAAFKIRLLLFILTWATLQPCLPDPGLLTWLPRLTLDPWAYLVITGLWLTMITITGPVSARIVTMPSPFHQPLFPATLPQQSIPLKLCALTVPPSPRRGV